MVCRSLGYALIASACVFIGRANATVYDFVLTGSRVASFSINSNTAPSNATPFQVQYSNVAGSFNGAAGTAPTISFGLSPLVGDFEIVGTSLGFSQFSGPILFTGTAANPMFLTGTSSLSSIVAGSSTLTITAEAAVAPAPSPVPEPASLAVLALATGGLAMLRRRRQPPNGCSSA